VIFDGKKVHFVYKYNNIDLNVKVYSLFSHRYKTGCSVVVICDRAIDSKNKGEAFQMLKHHHHKDVWNVEVEFYAMLNLSTRWR